MSFWHPVLRTAAVSASMYWIEPCRSSGWCHGSFTSSMKMIDGSSFSATWVYGFT